MASTPVMSPVLAPAPTFPGRPVADPGAARLLERAHGAIQKWPEDFAGFRAIAHCRIGCRESAGPVWVRPGGSARVDIPDAALAAWTEAALADVSSRQTPRFFKDGDGRFPVAFGPEDDHPLGRLVLVHLGPAEYIAYRIDRAGRMRLEERVAGGIRSVTTVDEFARATPGRVLPKRLTRSSWELRTGAVVESQSIEASYCRIASVWLPVSRVADRAAPASTAAAMELSDHHLL
jgi:hypothetical protein